LFFFFFFFVPHLERTRARARVRSLSLRVLLLLLLLWLAAAEIPQSRRQRRGFQPSAFHPWFFVLSNPFARVLPSPSVDALVL
jgi:hypothetical protein